MLIHCHDARCDSHHDFSFAVECKLRQGSNRTFCDGGHSSADGRLSDFAVVSGDNPPEEQTMNIVTKESASRFISGRADELTADELEHVWGGKPSAASQDQPVRFLEFKMKEVLISGISA